MGRPVVEASTPVVFLLEGGGAGSGGGADGGPADDVVGVAPGEGAEGGATQGPDGGSLLLILGAGGQDPEGNRGQGTGRDNGGDGIAFHGMFRSDKLASDRRTIALETRSGHHELHFF